MSGFQFLPLASTPKLLPRREAKECSRRELLNEVLSEESWKGPNQYRISTSGGQKILRKLCTFTMVHSLNPIDFLDFTTDGMHFVPILVLECAFHYQFDIL